MAGGAWGGFALGPPATGMSLTSYTDVLAACPKVNSPYAPRT